MWGAALQRRPFEEDSAIAKTNLPENVLDYVEICLPKFVMIIILTRLLLCCIIVGVYATLVVIACKPHYFYICTFLFLFFFFLWLIRFIAERN